MKKKLNSILKSMCAVGAAAAVSLVMQFNAAASSAEVVDSEMLTQINNLRTQRGLSALVLDESLTDIAETRANEASFKWSHQRPNGEQGTDMISNDKWRGENLSYVNYSNYSGTSSEQEIVADVMFQNLCNSQAHLDNMVFSEYTKIGIASYEVATSNGKKITTAYMFSN